MTDLKWLPLVGATVVSLKTWQEIPQNLKPVLLHSARQTSARYKLDVRKLNDDSIQVMKKHGLAVHPVPRETGIEWERRARAGYQRLVGKVLSAQTLADVERLRTEYRDLHNQK
jgi:TRAP-type C4-dicarboxylate transport system substrate-binding protein